MRRSILVGGGVALALGLATARVEARAQNELGNYSINDAFSTAVRFVRIDKGCKIVDKDADAAFVAFECTDDGKTKRGSFELIKTTAGVRAQLTLTDDTFGMELRWLELYERKLHEERGTPPPPPKDEKPKDEKPKDMSPSLQLQ